MSVSSRLLAISNWRSHLSQHLPRLEPLRMPRQKTRFELITQLVAWMAVVAALAFIVLVMLLERLPAETCLRKIDNNIERLAGHRWQWRTVDGKQCWFYSNRLLPREDLVWSFTEEEFNSDIDRVLERKFYKPVLDENELLIDVD